MKDFLTKERKYENVILLIMSIIACTLSILIFTKVVTLKFKDSISPNTFAWILLILGLLSLILSLYKLTRKESENK